jgi:hypothetical protein
MLRAVFLLRRGSRDDRGHAPQERLLRAVRRRHRRHQRLACGVIETARANRDGSARSTPGATASSAR